MKERFLCCPPIRVHLFNQALRELSVSSEICQEVLAAVGLLKRRKFDAVIVDLQLGEQSAVILDEVHRSSSNGTAVTFGIVSNDAEGTAFRKRSDFAFDRPLSAKSIRNILKPAYGLILRERRRYFRCPVSVPVIIQRETGKEVRCNSINISGGGIALSTFILLVPGESVQIQFTLPDHPVPFLAASTICWSKKCQKRDMREFASYPCRTTTSPNCRSGSRENWKRCYRNPLWDNFDNWALAWIPRGARRKLSLWTRV